MTVSGYFDHWPAAKTPFWPLTALWTRSQLWLQGIWEWPPSCYTTTSTLYVPSRNIALATRLGPRRDYIVLDGGWSSEKKLKHHISFTWAFSSARIVDIILLLLSTLNHWHQARRQGGFEGVRSNPPFGLQKHRLTVHFKCVLPFKSGPLALMLLRITTIQTNLVTSIYAGLFMEISAERARKRFTPLRWKDARVNTCVNKSLFQALQSSPVVLLVSQRLNCFADIFSVFSDYFTICHPPAVLSTIVPSLVEIWC